MMTSQFAPLVRLKKEQLEAVRRQLSEAHQRIQKLEGELRNLEAELLNLKLPASGNMKLFSQHQAYRQACHDQIILKKDAIYYALQQAHEIEAKLKKAHIEFEKFNYLKVEDEKAYAAQMKKEEALHLDEVAIMGYNARNNT